MTRIEILPIGRELLYGRVMETNANWMAKKITAEGKKVARITILNDHEDVIAQEISQAKNRHTDFLITCGGLGPTFDDITIPALAKGTNLDLELNLEALEFVGKKYREYFKKGFVPFEELTAEREKMALLPKGCRWLPNREGSAPGVLFYFDKMAVFALPGPPKELQPMFTDYVLPTIAKAEGDKGFLEVTINTDGKDESVLTPLCKELVEAISGIHAKTNPNFFGSSNGISITLSAWGENQELCGETIDKARKWLKEKLPEIGLKALE